jgi:uncharacterized protein (TIGR02466 family)
MSKFIDSLFQVPVYYDNINLKTVDIKKYILNIYKKENSLKNSNVGGFHTPYFDLNNPILSELINNIQKITDEYFKLCKFKEAKLRIKNMWAIVNNYKDHNVSHYHPHALLSGAFYVSFPEKGGNIVFEHPSPFLCNWDLLEKEEHNVYNSSSWMYQIKEKDIFLFPNWLWHKVAPNLSKEKRIVISFNIGF